MDSDTFWSANDMHTIWDKFDCSRGNKEVVLSTEMSCWVGRYCTLEDLHRWYLPYNYKLFSGSILDYST